MLARYLETIGHLTQVAGDGATALRVAAEFVPAVALVDLGLPRMDGFELARRLREQPSGSPRQLIAVTGYGQPADRRRSDEAGFDAHLVKPVDLDVLAALIARAAT